MENDPTRGWRELSPEIDLHIVPGNHGDMVQEPNVRELAQKLQASLAHASSPSFCASSETRCI
jgi:thioesterase domain-containing protein